MPARPTIIKFSVVKYAYGTPTKHLYRLSIVYIASVDA